MNNLQVRQLNRGQARRAFFTSNETDFPAGSPGGRVAAAMDMVIAAILADAGVQSSGAVSQKVAAKDENFVKFKKLMRQTARAGDALAEEFEGFEDLFNLPYGDAEEVWLAKGRAFYAESENYEDEMQDYISTPNFRAGLMTLITKIEAVSTDKDIAEEQRGGATGSLRANFRELGRLGRKANSIVVNKYEEDPKKLAEWAIASHLAAAPKGGEEVIGEKK
ncbi:MAG: hypothetical protein WA584_18320 [Pyrinomonadaceae bacterium]